MVVKHVNSDEEYATVVATAADKVMCVDFFATWCGPCRTIAPVFEQLSVRYPHVLFVKVDVDKCATTAAAEGISAMPTFNFYSNKIKVDTLRGANAQELDQKVKRWAETATGGASSVAREPCPQPGQLNLMNHLDKSKCECMNEANRHSLKNIVDGTGSLMSDADEQVCCAFATQSPVSVDSQSDIPPADEGAFAALQGA